AAFDLTAATRSSAPWEQDDPTPAAATAPTGWWRPSARRASTTAGVLSGPDLATRPKRGWSGASCRRLGGTTGPEGNMQPVLGLSGLSVVAVGAVAAAGLVQALVHSLLSSLLGL